MRFTCQSCGRTYIVAQELAGLAFKMKCKACGHVIAVRPAAPTPSPPGPSGTVEARPQTKPPARPSPEPPKAPPPVQAAPLPEVAAAPASPAAPPEARAPRPPRDAERPEAAARPAEPAPPRPRHRRMPNPRLHQPTFVLSAILAVLVAVYFYLNRDPVPKPAQRPVATPVQAAPRPEASQAQRQAAPAREPAAPQAVPSSDPASRTTVGTRLP